MGISFWKRLSYALGLLAICGLFALIVLSANVEVRDLDLWLHLKMGEVIIQNHYVPDKDILSCSIAGKPWINHEWLFQIIVYAIYRHWGPNGLITMQVCVVILTFLVLLFLGYNKKNQFSAAFFLLLVMLVYQSRFTIRPDIFSLFFFASYFLILALHIDKRWSVYVLFVIQVLWANFHGFSFLGPFLVMIGIAAEYLKRRAKLPWQWNKTGRLSDGEYKRLKQILVFVVLASFINPQIVKGAWYPLNVLVHLPGESRLFFRHIQELRPPISWDNIFSIERYAYYKLLIILSFLGFVFNRKKIDIGDLFLWVIFLSVSLVAVRNLVFFAIVAYLSLMTNLIDLPKEEILPVHFTEKKFHHITSALSKVLLIVWMSHYGVGLLDLSYFDFDRYEMKSNFGGVDKRHYPQRGVDFLVTNGIKGNFFNDFNSGAYLIGRCFPQIKVFIDGRTEVYGPAFFKEYLKILKEGSIESFKQAVERYHLTGAFLNSTREPLQAEILTFLYNDENWAPVYFDYDAVIFLKRTEVNEALIKRFKIDFSKWKVPKTDLSKLETRMVTPYRHVNRAYTLETLGFDQLAQEEIAEALKIAPGYSEIYKILGKIYWKTKDYQKAFENFRIAAMISPQEMDTRSDLALAYEQIGDFDAAIKQYRAMIYYQPSKSKAYYKLARIYAKDNQCEKAVETIKAAFRLDPDSVGGILKMGDLMYGKKEYNFAKEVYKIALTAEENSRLAEIHKKLGLCYRAMGSKKEAQEEFQKAKQYKTDKSTTKTK